MGNNKYTYYGNQFKAKVALAALKGATISELSEKHEVSEQEIKAWEKRLENRAELFSWWKKRRGLLPIRLILKSGIIRPFLKQRWWPHLIVFWSEIWI